MKIQITAGGIYGADGKEVDVGTTFDVKEEPVAWVGRYTVVSGKDGGKTAITNPKAEDALKAEHHGGGKFNITQGETVLATGLSKADADAFNSLSDEEKADYVKKAD